MRAFVVGMVKIPLLCLMSVQLCRVNEELKWIWKLETFTQACTSHQAGSYLILAETVYFSELSCAILVVQVVVLFYSVSVAISL